MKWIRHHFAAKDLHLQPQIPIQNKRLKRMAYATLRRVHLKNKLLFFLEIIFKMCHLLLKSKKIQTDTIWKIHALPFVLFTICWCQSRKYWWQMSRGYRDTSDPMLFNFSSHFLLFYGILKDAFSKRLQRRIVGWLMNWIGSGRNGA
jgi:hypothetical protein